MSHPYSIEEELSLYGDLRAAYARQLAAVAADPIDLEALEQAYVEGQALVARLAPAATWVERTEEDYRRLRAVADEAAEACRTVAAALVVRRREVVHRAGDAARGASALRAYLRVDQPEAGSRFLDSQR